MQKTYPCERSRGESFLELPDYFIKEQDVRLRNLGLPDGLADKERPDLAEVLRRLPRLAHPLDDGRERIQRLAQEPDDEVVVVRIKAVTRQADVVRVVGATIGTSDASVFHQDGALFVGA